MCVYFFMSFIPIEMWRDGVEFNSRDKQVGKHDKLGLIGDCK